MDKNIFEKIRDGESPAEIVLKNDYVTAFQDIYPNAPVHILLIPNKKISSLADLQEDDAIFISHIFIAAKQIAETYKINETGYRVITNCGKYGGQEIPYLHFHLLGGVPLGKMTTLPKSSKKTFKEFQIHQFMNKPIPDNKFDLHYNDFLKTKKIHEQSAPCNESITALHQNALSTLDKNDDIDVLIVKHSLIKNKLFDSSTDLFKPFGLWYRPDAVTDIRFDTKGHDVNIKYVINNEEYELNEIDYLLHVCTDAFGYAQFKIYFGEGTSRDVDIDFYYTGHYLSAQNRIYLSTQPKVHTDKVSYRYLQFNLSKHISGIEAIDTTYKTWFTEDSTQTFLTNAVKKNKKGE